ncbi:MAG TPA: DUF4314 domain-containing protein, partial [Catenuloplanes sp.]
MIFQPGERVALVHTNDPHTRLRPGDQGTVSRHDHHLHTVEVDWDSGSRLSMVLDAGDHIRRIADPEPTRPDNDPTGADGPAWQQLLTTVRERGAVAGRNAIEWWAQHTVGGRASGDVAATARRILAGIDDGDPAVLQTLPTVHSADDADRIANGDVYAEAADTTASSWPMLTGRQRDEVGDAYRDGFDTTVEDAAAARCRAVASPTGDGRNLSHLHPDRLRIGGVGVFSGDWAWTTNADGEWRIPVGFVGTLVDTWNGWAVFSCTRQVAEAIVAEQQDQRDRHRQGLREQGVADADLDARTNAELTSLTFDGHTIVADQRGLSDDPEAIEWIEPDPEGRYVVMGRNWCWEAVDPADCDRIVGELPAPDEQQQFVILTHTGMSVPHDRVRVTSLDRRPTHTGTAFTATVQVDGQPAGTITNDGHRGPTELTATHPQLGPDRIAAYVHGCRHHGQPVTEPHVLDALVAEYDLAEQTRQATDNGATMLRLLDDDGSAVHLRPVWPAPRGHVARVQLGRHLNRTHQHPAGVAWQIWTGTGWQHLTQTRTGVALDADSDNIAAGAGSEVNPIRVFADVSANAQLDTLTRDH